MTRSLGNLTLACAAACAAAFATAAWAQQTPPAVQKPAAGAMAMDKDKAGGDKKAMAMDKDKGGGDKKAMLMDKDKGGGDKKAMLMDKGGADKKALTPSSTVGIQGQAGKGALMDKDKGGGDKKAGALGKDLKQIDAVKGAAKP